MLNSPQSQALRVVVLFLILAIALLLTETFVAQRALSTRPRFTTDFSEAYLDAQLRSIAEKKPDAVFLGDSVLWGFRERFEDTAVAILQRRGCSCVNLAFKAGGPPNSYLIAKLLLRDQRHPKTVVLEVNQRTANESDSSYRTVVPAVSALGGSLLTPSDRNDLKLTPGDGSGPFGKLMDSVWPVYAMRSEIRESITGDDDSAPVVGAPDPVPDDFVGTYDISPLTEHNLAVRYLSDTVRSLRAGGVAVVAFTTPTNHRLLHEFIDDPIYEQNDAFLVATLRHLGAKVLDLDRSVPASDFIDNDHLNTTGQVRLANLLGPAIRFQPRP